MAELKEKANSYAEENVLEVLKEAFAKVYADGYHDGYKDCEEEIPIDLHDNRTEYVDLGLPSGTLWSKEFEQNGDKVRYLPYCDASNLFLPTEEQWNELWDNCQWTFIIDNAYDLCKAKCVGPNGNILIFESTGKINYDTLSKRWEVFFWIRDEKEGNKKSAVHMYNGGKKGPGANSKNAITILEDFFCGYKLPVRLVKKK